LLKNARYAPAKLLVASPPLATGNTPVTVPDVVFTAPVAIFADVIAESAIFPAVTVRPAISAESMLVDVNEALVRFFKL
jgi:hypothetical protein